MDGLENVVAVAGAISVLITFENLCFSLAIAILSSFDFLYGVNRVILFLAGWILF